MKKNCEALSMKKKMLNQGKKFEGLGGVSLWDAGTVLQPTALSDSATASLTHCGFLIGTSENRRHEGY